MRDGCRPTTSFCGPAGTGTGTDRTPRVKDGREAARDKIRIHDPEEHRDPPPSTPDPRGRSRPGGSPGVQPAGPTTHPVRRRGAADEQAEGGPGPAPRPEVEAGPGSRQPAALRAGRLCGQVPRPGGDG